MKLRFETSGNKPLYSQFTVPTSKTHRTQPTTHKSKEKMKAVIRTSLQKTVSSRETSIKKVHFLLLAKVTSIVLQVELSHEDGASYEDEDGV